jgi:ketosteroid isomerase-like protein
MKAPCIHLIVLILLGSTLAGCGPREQSLPENVITALQTHYNSRDPKGAAELFTDDGAILRESAPPVRGKAAIANFLQVELKNQLQYWISSEGNVVSGNIAYDQGNYRVRNINQMRDIESGKYVTIFKKINGQWKIFRAINNTNSPKTCDVVPAYPAGSSTDGSSTPEK